MRSGGRTDRRHPAGGGGGRTPAPRDGDEPTARSGPPGSMGVIGGSAEDALRDCPSPSRVPAHLPVPSGRDSHPANRAAASDYCLKPSASRRRAPLDAPPQRPADWPARATWFVLLPEPGGLRARVLSEHRSHPPILGARGPVVVPFDPPCWHCPGRVAEPGWLASVSGRPPLTYRLPWRRVGARKDTRWSTLASLTSLSHLPAFLARRL